MNDQRTFIPFQMPFDYFLQVSYVSIATREIFSKVGRELLAAIATAHPHIISVLLERLRETIEKVGMVSDVKHLFSPPKTEELFT